MGNEIEKNMKENKEMNEETNRRMKKLEEDMRKISIPSKGSETLNKMELEMIYREGEET